MKYVIPEVPPSNNRFSGRENVWEYRKEKQRWLGLVKAFCRPKPQEPLPKAVVTLRYFFGRHLRRDPDNYSGKMILDGLVAGGILKDDSFDCITLRIEQGGFDKHNPRTEIEVEAP